MFDTTEGALKFTVELNGLREQKKIATVCARKGEIYASTSMILKQLVDGATFGRDRAVVEYTLKLRKKILVLKQKWLTQKVFLEQPANLFWVEGSSLAILHNYIPRGQRNVYHVAYTQPLMNLTRVRMMLNWARSTEVLATNRCQFVCDKTHVFTDTDLVHTHDPFLSSKHKAKIEFFADKY
jgi:hypothetical protein